MLITVEMVIALVTIASPLFVGAFALWGMVTKKFVEVDKATEKRVEAVRAEQQKTQDRLDALEKNAVTKEEYFVDRQNTDNALENIARTVREGNATMTGRIDLVLFEIGRQRNSGKQD